MFMNLPNEILQKILRVADTDSRLACWSTCTRLRELLRSKTVVTELKLSGELGESAKDLARYVTLLCVVTPSTPCLNLFPFYLFENLHSLDLREADTHLLSIHRACADLPNLVSLSVVFEWFYAVDAQGDEGSILEFISVLSQCQKNIRSLKKINFLIFSGKVLYFDKYLHILKLCTSLETLNIELKQNSKRELYSKHDVALGKLKIPPSLNRLSVFVHTCYYGGPTILMRMCAKAGWERISFNCNCSVIPLNMSATNAFKLLHQSTEVRVEKIGEITWRNEWRMFDEENEKSFHLLFHPKLDTLHPNIFDMLSEKIISHHPQCDLHAALSERKSERLCNLCVCTFPTISCHEQPNVHKFTLKDIPIVQNMKLSIKCQHEDERLHILQVDEKLVTECVHLHHLSFLDLNSALISCNWKAFFMCCPRLHTLIVTNNSSQGCGNTSYREVLENLHALPSLKNFLCDDSTLFPDELLRKCTECKGLVNIHLCFHSKRLELLSVLDCTYMLSKCLQLETLEITVETMEVWHFYTDIFGNVIKPNGVNIEVSLDVLNRRHACFHFVSCYELADDLRT